MPDPLNDERFNGIRWVSITIIFPHAALFFPNGTSNAGVDLALYIILITYRHLQQILFLMTFLFSYSIGFICTEFFYLFFPVFLLIHIFWSLGGPELTEEIHCYHYY